MAGERRGGGLEITSPQGASGGGRARAPGEVIFDLVFSNESLWGTVDPHGAQTIVEKSIADKGVVDLGDLMREFVDRKTKPDLARGTVLAFAMELARAGVAIRLPAELQSLDRTSRQKLVDVFRAGQKSADEPTKTLAQPSSSGPRAPASASRPPSPRSGNASSVPSPSSASPRASAPPSRSPTTTERTDQALDGWSQGLGAVTDARAASKNSSPGKGATGETSNPSRPARAPTEAGRERSRTNIERPRPAEKLAVGAMFGPGRVAALSVTAVFLLIGVIVGPRGSIVVAADPLPPEIPCVRVEKNGPHVFCIVDLDALPPRLTIDDIETRKAAMLSAARGRGLVSVTFYNPDLTRWDPIPAPIRIEAQVAKRVDDDGEEEAPRFSGTAIREDDVDEGAVGEDSPSATPEAAPEVYVPRDQRPQPKRKGRDHH